MWEAPIFSPLWNFYVLSKEKKGRSENELLVCSVPSCASHLLNEVELGKGSFAFKLVGKKYLSADAFARFC